MKLFLTLSWLMMPALVFAQPLPVEISQDAEGGWQLLRDGEPYFIRGAGGDQSLAALAAAGGNTIRTWGIGSETGELLDRAHRLGLAVVLGHWLGHERHGFDYTDREARNEQLERVRRDVLLYKDHPALLLWGVGNEMEGFAQGADPDIWTHVQDVAAMIKELDPLHPTMVVTADIGGERVPSVHALCPDIDIMGINSYGGAPSLPARYPAAGGSKPYVITEFGPLGVWEIGRTSFGSPPEPTSTEKAAMYAAAYRQGCLDAGGLCLGSFAFAWGAKAEATATWYGMFLPDGEKLAAVDVMTELWSGKKPADLCPEIRSFGLRGPEVVQAGDTIQVDLDVIDPEGLPVQVDWTVRGEAEEFLTGGDVQVLPLPLKNIIVEESVQGASLIVPSGGIYRLYLTAHDGQGGAATANVPFKVEGPSLPRPPELPVVVYADGQAQRWAPSGWMGTHAALSMDLECPDNPHSGPTCLRFTYDQPGLWTGVAWQHPPNDWGDQPGGFDLTGAEKLTFWARGEKGGERLDFSVGIITSGKPFHDTAFGSKKNVKLKKEWKRYSIKLEGEDLTRVKTPFVWTLGGQGRTITFYLDDIRFE